MKREEAVDVVRGTGNISRDLGSENPDAGFSRIRNADLGRFTVDRLMAILNRLGSRIEVKVRVRRERAA